MIPLIASALGDPVRAGDMSPATWTDLVVQARETGLLARLGERIDREIGLDAVPTGPRRHLSGAMAHVRKQNEDVRREIDWISQALAPLGVDVVLMKGAAYVARDMAPATGRSFEDVDILVPEHRLAEVEAALREHGWTRGDLSRHDARYYYEWMHQIPPLEHVERSTVLDVHHSILPRTARPRIFGETLLAESVPVPGMPGVRTLADTDLLLHSAVHLFNEGEFGHGLRDISDMDLMLRRHLATGEAAGTLAARARELGLEVPWAHARHACATLFDTPLTDASEGGAGLLRRTFHAAILPHAAGTPWRTVAARHLLYIRGHLLKMPLSLLVPHLWTKMWAARRE